ncbi:MAG: hypothetical protein ACYDDE_06470 [bacterium]
MSKTSAKELFYIAEEDFKDGKNYIPIIPMNLKDWFAFQCSRQLKNI